MFFYQISVPLKINIDLIYKYGKPLKSGIRVIVSVGRNIYTGIVLNSIDSDSVDTKIRYKTILEIVDDEPVMSQNMIKLAKWMSAYYKTAIGIVIDTMLPLALKHHITQKVKIRNHSKIYDIKNTEKAIFDLIKNADEWVQVSALRESVKSQDFYHAIESMEREQVIDVFRTFDEKIKPKYANHVRIDNSHFDQLHNLTEKQRLAYEFVYKKNNQGDSDIGIPLSTLVNEFSYATLKALEKKELIKIYPKKIDPDLYLFSEAPKPRSITLNQEQNNVIKEICDTLETLKFSSTTGCNKNQTYLLYGITGSGKTEVYIEAIKQAQKLGKSALMLIPEISLTPQTVHRFYQSFGNEIAVLHSSLTDRERYIQWKMIAQGKICIVVGARSAIFAPLKDIGVVIVDEEHELSYKQEQQPCYNGRDIAVMRGNIENAVVILGSATPSLESWHNVLAKKYKLLTLSQRPGDAILPSVKIVDMRNNKETDLADGVDGKSGYEHLVTEQSEGLFSNMLKEKILDRLEKREQVILFHNRRGYANFLQCSSCGNLSRCPHCDISLCYHKSDNMILCHYCGYGDNVPRKCRDCGSYHFLFGSPGTEQIDSQMKILFPSAKILRMDSDTTKKKNSFKEMFEAMKNQYIDILIGTQMISKGLDFPNVTLVGVVLADITLNVPDFRSTERTFQLLTQVAGRSGRGKKKGEVIIQTRNPSHYALVYAARQDYLSFSKRELILRSEAFYPPKHRLARVLFSSTDQQFLKEKLISSNLLLLKLKSSFPQDEFILLPFIEAPLPKIKNKFRYHFIIKSTKTIYIQRFLDMFLDEFICPQKIDMLIDIDPMSLL